MRRFLQLLSRPGLALFYLLILLEGVYMTSFFAIYLFSSYVPIQAFLESTPALSWLTDFYLSHFIRWSGAPSSPSTPGNIFRLNVYDRRNAIWFVGFLLFFAGAVPIYWGKITRRPEVTGGIYRFIRNPQYLGFAVIGIPFLVIWPRMILLLSYVTMLFAYYLLARREEQICLAKYGASFQAYLERTPSMFLPGDRWIVDKLQAAYQMLSAQGRFRLPVLAATYVLLCAATVAAAYAFKHRAIRQASPEFNEDRLGIALDGADRPHMSHLLAAAATDRRVREALAESRERGRPFTLQYLVPADGWGAHFYLDHYANTRPAEKWTGVRTAAYDVEPGVETIPREQIRSLVIWGISKQEARNPEDILDRFEKVRPIVVVGLDLRGPRIIGVVKLAPIDRAADPLRGARMPLL